MISIYLQKRRFWLLATIGIVLLGITLYIYNKVFPKDYGHKVVVCIPVYGQSLALGEEATRITDFDSLRIKYDGRIVTENLDYTFGYFDHSSQFKQWVKRVLHYDKKAFELSVYSMAEDLATELGEDTIVCIFPGGHGMNTIQQLMKPAEPYQKFIKEITTAYEKAQERGWEFYVPAVCWMQGESDIVEYPDYDYKEYFHRMYNDLNTDIKKVTHQTDNIRIISYQSSTITKGLRYKPNNYDGTEPNTPTVQMELIRDDTLVWASGPTYPYDFVNESLHIDAVGQQAIGKLAARSALGIIRKQKRNIGLVPIAYHVEGNDIRIDFNVPNPPLFFDTIQVKKIANYGFNVIRRDGTDIISNVAIDNNSVIIHCAESPINSKLRYGINGEFLKGGRNHGPRGNLRDSEKNISNWCLIFENVVE
jgi:hypothetical protein